MPHSNAIYNKTVPFFQRIRVRLHLLNVFFLLIFLGFQIHNIYATKQSIITEKRILLRSVVTGAYGVLDYFKKMGQEKGWSIEETQSRAYQALREMPLDTSEKGKEKSSESPVVWQAKDGKYVMHWAPQAVGHHVFETVQGNETPDQLLRDRMEKIMQADDPDNPRYMYFVSDTRARPDNPDVISERMFSYYYYPDWDVVITVGTWMDEVNDEFAAVLKRELLYTALVGGVILLIGMYIANHLLRQIGGEPVVAIDMMDRAAQGDFTIAFPPDLPPNSMLGAFKKMVDELRGIIREIGSNAHVVSTSTQQLNQAIAKVADAANYQTEETGKMASAIEQLTVSVSQISESSKNTQKYSEEVAELCRSGRSIVQDSSTNMGNIAEAMAGASQVISTLEERADQISFITASIKEIAEQTNLLALNAAIEAARAGEEGQGFSVVADEVRKLAERTAEATREIDTMVKTVQSDTRQSTSRISGIEPMVQDGNVKAHSVEEALREIDQRANLTLNLVSDVATESDEQSVVGQSIARQVEKIAGFIEQTNAVVRSTSAEVQSLTEVAEKLTEVTRQFKV